MDDVTFLTAAGQNAFTVAERVGDYAIAFPLAPGEPDALEITAPYWGLANSYTKPAASSNMAWGSTTAYFDDDVDFRDEGGGVTSWTRRWLTKPNAWSEPGGTYAFTFPAYVSAASFGTAFPATAITTSGANYVVNTNATGISAGGSVLFDLNFIRAVANYHVTFVADVLAASSGSSVTLPGILPGSGAFTGVSGTVRAWSPGRSTPEAMEVDSVLLRDYAVSSESAKDTDLPQVPRFQPVDALGNETLFLTTGSGSTPNANSYAEMVTSGQYLVAAPSDLRRYGAQIYERTTRLVKAR